MDIIKRIDGLIEERGWNDYKLSQFFGLSPSIISNMHRRNTVTSIATLEVICTAFGIALSQFFEENTTYVYLSKEQCEFIKTWAGLTPK